jgi:hypothetical protein
MYADSYLKGENETLRGNEKNEEGSLKRDGGNKTDESKNPHHKQTRHITIREALKSESRKVGRFSSISTSLRACDIR